MEELVDDVLQGALSYRFHSREVFMTVGFHLLQYRSVGAGDCRAWGDLLRLNPELVGY